jgi:hypothetical protein
VKPPKDEKIVNIDKLIAHNIANIGNLNVGNKQKDFGFHIKMRTLQLKNPAAHRVPIPYDFWLNEEVCTIYFLALEGYNTY